VKKTSLCVSLLLATVSSSVAIMGTRFGPQSAESAATGCCDEDGLHVIMDL